VPEAEISCECSNVLHVVKVSRDKLTESITSYLSGKYTRRIKIWDVWVMEHAKCAKCIGGLVGKPDISSVDTVACSPGVESKRRQYECETKYFKRKKKF
jgi:hypothetical protein